MEYFCEEMGDWLAVPFGDKLAAERLRGYADDEGGGGIPRLVLLDGDTGEIIHENARMHVEKDPRGSNFPWIDTKDARSSAQGSGRRKRLGLKSIRHREILGLPTGKKKGEVSSAAAKTGGKRTTRAAAKAAASDKSSSSSSSTVLSAKVVMKAYRKKSLALHPDKAVAKGVDAKVAAKNFDALVKAKEALLKEVEAENEITGGGGGGVGNDDDGGGGGSGGDESALGLELAALRDFASTAFGPTSLVSLGRFVKQVSRADRGLPRVDETLPFSVKAHPQAGSGEYVDVDCSRLSSCTSDGCV